MQDLEGAARALVAQEAHDQAGRDAELALAFGERRRDAADHLVERHAAHDVALRVEEDLDVAGAVGRGAAQIGGRSSQKSASWRSTAMPR